jgi:hypothetical protein
MEMSTYIKAFEWSDELAKEYAEQYRFSSSRITVEQFKESKQPKPEWEIIGYAYPLGTIDQIDTSVIGPFHYNWNNAVVRDYPIHSVKRLSDGEMFSIGDKVWPNLTIKSFYFPKEHEARYGECSLAVIFEEPHANYCFKDLKHRAPIFTSDNLVEYYEGEMKDIYCLNDAGSWHIDFHPEYYPQLKGSYNKFFSTREAAEEYILFNKPLLSLNEIESIGQISDADVNPAFKRLIRAAKDKLNH